MKVKIFSTNALYRGFINLNKAELEFEKFDGAMSEKVSRLNVFRGDAVSVLLYDLAKKQLFFVRQFRYPIYTTEPNNAWPLEVVAGSIENKDSPQITAIREVEEEVGFVLKKSDLISLGRCYPSPGGTSERIFMFAADITRLQRSTLGGGADHEEDIQVVQLSFSETMSMLDHNQIQDAKTLLSLHWFRQHIYTASYAE